MGLSEILFINGAMTVNAIIGCTIIHRYEKFGKLFGTPYDKPMYEIWDTLTPISIAFALSVNIMKIGGVI